MNAHQNITAIASRGSSEGEVIEGRHASHGTRSKIHPGHPKWAPADIDAVISSFGQTGDLQEDVDVSGEVDAADIDIVIANFGAVDE